MKDWRMNRICKVLLENFDRNTTEKAEKGGVNGESGGESDEFAK